MRVISMSYLLIKIINQLEFHKYDLFKIKNNHLYKKLFLNLSN